jgi:NCS1 family nucleobase:cation symporter-1
MSTIADSQLSNKDLAPTGPERRTWGTYHLAALWVGLSIVISTYTLASGLIIAGMEWWQGLLTVSLGNLIVLIPILLNSQPGTKYGIPFPVLVRSSFGIRGANVAAMARALVACGWFGIQTWIGALAIDTLMTTLTSSWADVDGHKAIAFGAFWVIQVLIILRGIEGIKFLESYAAPLLLGGSLGLLIWGFGAAGNVFEASGRLIEGDQSFWTLFGPGLAANVGYWITLSMNIPDFTRYAKNQRSQLVGQSIAMPLTMIGFSFIGIAVTCATVLEFGEPIWDPVTLVARLLDDLPVLLVIAMVIVVLAQISTNMAANVVSPSNDFSNLAPRIISFKVGGLITAVIGIISFPWKLFEDAQAYIFTWLIGYGSLLAAFLAVMLVDYWLLRRARLDVEELYRYGPGGRYWYSNGFNVRALVAAGVGIVVVLPGFLNAALTEGGRQAIADPGFFDRVYDYGVFVAFALSALTYVALMRVQQAPAPATATAD